MVELLLEKATLDELKCPCKENDSSYWTTIMYAADRGHTQCLNSLLEKARLLERPDCSPESMLMNHCDEKVGSLSCTSYSCRVCYFMWFHRHIILLYCELR